MSSNRFVQRTAAAVALAVAIVGLVAAAASAGGARPSPAVPRGATPDAAAPRQVGGVRAMPRGPVMGGPDPILVWCSQPDAVVAVSGGSTTAYPCPSPHGAVTLPPSVDRIECQRGTAAVPQWVAYQLHPGGETYGVNCIDGDVVQLGIQGGRAQVVCPAEGEIAFYEWGFLGSIDPVAGSCTPGAIAPGAAALGPFTTSIDWDEARVLAGLVRCPASGSLSVHFLGEGSPTTNPAVAAAHSCTAGDPVDLTRLS